MANSFDLSTEILNDYDICRLSDRDFVTWVYAVGSAASQGRDIPDWADVRKKRKMRRATLSGAIRRLAERNLAENSPPFALLRRGDLWRIGSDRPLANEWAVIRSRIFERDNYTCQYCGVRGVKLECDHIVPVAKGGSHKDDNLATSCFPCNRSKRDKSVSEWLASRKVTQGHMA